MSIFCFHIAFTSRSIQSPSIALAGSCRQDIGRGHFFYMTQAGTEWNTAGVGCEHTWFPFKHTGVLSIGTPVAVNRLALYVKLRRQFGQQCRLFGKQRRLFGKQCWQKIRWAIPDLGHFCETVKLWNYKTTFFRDIPWELHEPRHWGLYWVYVCLCTIFGPFVICYPFLRREGWLFVALFAEIRDYS